jgi:two-component system response regulator RegA
MRLRSLLVVDDDPTLCGALAATLEACGPRVAIAETAAQAIRMLEQGPPDVVLLDLSLPDGDGFDVLDAVERTTPMPVVVAMSGVATPLQSFRLAQLGAAVYLEKPFSTAELLAAIDRALTEPTSIRPHLRGAVGHRSVHELQEELRTTMVEEALARARGSKTRAAALLGVSRQLLQFMLRQNKKGDRRREPDDGEEEGTRH